MLARDDLDGSELDGRTTWSVAARYRQLRTDTKDYAVDRVRSTRRARASLAPAVRRQSGVKTTQQRPSSIPTREMPPAGAGFRY